MSHRYFLRYSQFDPADFESMAGVVVIRDYACLADPTGTEGFLVISEHCINDQIT